MMTQHHTLGSAGGTTRVGKGQAVSVHIDRCEPRHRGPYPRWWSELGEQELEMAELGASLSDYYDSLKKKQ